MSEDTKMVYAIMCGELRMEFEFFTSLSYLCELRKKGEINGIILSTWKGEIEKIPSLRKSLFALDIHIVETEPFDSTGYFDLGYVRQVTQLREALKRIPANSFVLKCRTDYCHWDLLKMKDVSTQIEVPVQSHGDFSIDFKYKISVLRAPICEPFMFHDISFVGLKEDLQKIVTIIPMKNYQKYYIPDVYIFATLFINDFSIVSDFFQYINFCEFTDCMSNLRAKQNNFILPDFLNKFYALYFIIIYCAFSFCRDDDSCDDITYSMEDIFYGNSSKKIKKNKSGHLSILNFDIIKKVIDGKIIPSIGYEKLYLEICKMKDKNYVYHQELSLKQYKELQQWGKEYFGQDVDWLYPYDKIGKQDQGNNIGIFESIKLLFDNYDIDQKTEKAIYDICYSEDGYYDEIVKKLSLFECNEELYKIALFSSGRYLNDDILFRCAELLYNEKLSKQEQEKAFYYFRRYSQKTTDKYLFSFPMENKRILALFYVSMYEEKNLDTNIIVQGWIKAICEFFKIKFDNEITGLKSLVELLEEMKSTLEPENNTSYYNELIDAYDYMKNSLDNIRRKT